MNGDLLELLHDLVDGRFQVMVGRVLQMFRVALAVVGLQLFSSVLLFMSSNQFPPLPFSFLDLFLAANLHEW